MHAVQAAHNIFNELRSSYLLEDPSLSSRFQIIHLIGHSRGAAVNARVSRLLHDHQYSVHQYTALDGFSTDWQSDAAKIADINIATETVARKRVNYTVTKDLLRWGVEEYKDRRGFFELMEKLLKMKGLPFGLTLSPFAQEHLANLHMRAPDRSGFINRLIQDSHHVNIQELFMASSELYENFAGAHRANSACDPNSWLPISSTFARASFESSVQSPATDEIAADTIRDGSFEQLGSLARDLLASSKGSTGIPFLDGWMQFMAAPTNILSTLWKVSGQVDLIHEGTNTFVQLAPGAETSLGQLLDLKDGPKQPEFDLAIEQANPGARLQVRCGNDVLQELPLDEAKPFQHLAVRMDSQFGPNRVSFAMVGEVLSSQATIWLDNIAITYLAPQFVGIECSASGGLTLHIKGASGVKYVIESSADLVHWRDEAAAVPAKSASVPVSITMRGEASRVFRMRQDGLEPVK
jgi:hypothetical protein